MFKVNDKVVHFRDGISTIVDITNMMEREYFVVRADNGGSDNIYVLKDNTANIIRPIMSKKEASDVINYMRTVIAEFIDNTKQRRDIYKKRLLSGSVYDLAYLSRQLHFFHLYNEQGKVVKLGPTDLQFLKDAHKILFDELALSFQIAREKIESSVEKMLR